MTTLSAEKARILKIVGKEPSSMDELGHTIIRVVESQDNYDPAYKLGKHKKYRVIGFAWNLKRQMLPASCFRRRGIHGNHEVVGWTGRVWIRYGEKLNSFASDSFSTTLTLPGTGGFGNYQSPWDDVYSAFYQREKQLKSEGRLTGEFSKFQPHIYSWDYKILEEDWPLIHTSYQELELFRKLSGKKYVDTHNFLYNDSETVTSDSKFLKDSSIPLDINA